MWVQTQIFIVTCTGAVHIFFYSDHYFDYSRRFSALHLFLLFSPDYLARIACVHYFHLAYVECRWTKKKENTIEGRNCEYAKRTPYN